MIKGTPEGSSLQVRVSTKSGKSMIKGVREGALLVSLRSAPEKGRANAELIKLLAEVAGRPPSTIGIKRGETSRTKEVLFKAMEPKELESRISLLIER